VEYRRLGHSGLKVSEVSYGNWLTHGTSTDWGNSAACVRAAVDAGITTFQTAAAWGYGAAELSLANGLKGIDRDGLVLCTGAFWPEGSGPNEGGLSRKTLRNSLDNSLRRLETDYIDLYQLLRFDYQTPLEETFAALGDFTRQGKILYVGTAEWTAEQLQEAWTLAQKFNVQLVSNQPHYSMLWRVPESQVMPVCQRRGISQIASVTLAQGVLTGEYEGHNIPDDSRAAGNPGARMSVYPLLNPELLSRIAPLRGVAEHAGVTMAQLAIAWTLQNEDVATAVVGASKPEQLAENAKASGVKLDLNVLTQVDELLGMFVMNDPRLTFAPAQYRLDAYEERG
jgi:aryl-alcohol dehydrogenase-like predicted oxidoreductase